MDNLIKRSAFEGLPSNIVLIAARHCIHDNTEAGEQGHFDDQHNAQPVQDGIVSLHLPEIDQQHVDAEAAEMRRRRIEEPARWRIIGKQPFDHISSRTGAIDADARQ